MRPREKFESINAFGSSPRDFSLAQGRGSSTQTVRSLGGWGATIGERTVRGIEGVIEVETEAEIEAETEAGGLRVEIEVIDVPEAEVDLEVGIVPKKISKTSSRTTLKIPK